MVSIGVHISEALYQRLHDYKKKREKVERREERTDEKGL